MFDYDTDILTTKRKKTMETTDMETLTAMVPNLMSPA